MSYVGVFVRRLTMSIRFTSFQRVTSLRILGVSLAAVSTIIFSPRSPSLTDRRVACCGVAIASGLPPGALGIRCLPLPA